ncbi:MAG: PPOX class F420-dependent oxidoreductase [Pseudomonadota bacterium]
MTEQPFDPRTERYVSLATFRRDGRKVATPVWVAQADDRYYVFSEGKAGKVKRLRNSDRAQLAACDFRGNLKSNWMDARARLIDDPAVVSRAHRALREKYGWQMAVGDLFSRATGRFNKRAFIEIELE